MGDVRPERQSTIESRKGLMEGVTSHWLGLELCTPHVAASGGSAENRSS